MTLLAHSRLVLSGHISPSQSWSTGIGLTGTDESNPNAVTLQRFVDEFAPMVATWWAAVVPLNSADVSLEKLTLSSYPAGTNKAGAVAEHVLDPVLVGGAGPATSMPTFTACVVTLLTGVPGRSGRGRMYVPATAAPLSVHQFSEAQTEALSSGTAVLIRAMKLAETAGQPQLLPAVCGIKGNFPVTSVKVDTLPDSQHRREDKIGPASAAVTVI